MHPGLTLLRRYTIFTLLVFINTLYGQDVDKIRGTVIDGESLAPLSYANVYFNGTTIGTITDTQGEFAIPYNPNYTELVVAFIGYETFSISTKEMNLKKRYQIHLNQKSEVLSEVKINAKRDKRWHQNLRSFKDDFIGFSPNAKDLKIVNEAAIFFDYDDQARTFKVFAREPLVIENKALGYMIEYDLVEFTKDYNSQITFFAGYPRFTEMDGSKGKRKKWKKRRKKSYHGSAMHFMQCLVNETCTEEGFQVNQIRRVANPNYPSQEQIEWARADTRRKKKQGALSFNTNNPDSATVILRESRGSKYREMLEKDPLDPSNFVTDHSEYFALEFEDIWQVIYHKEKPDKEFLGGGSGPISISRKGPQTSTLRLTNGVAKLTPEGLVENPRELLYSGYWVYEKIGDLLPLDYKVEEDN